MTKRNHTNYFFSHYADQRNSLFLKLIKHELGHKGYALYFMLLEILITYNNTLDIKDKSVLRYLSLELDINQNELSSLLDFLIEINALEQKENIVCSVELKEHLETIEEKSKKYSENVKKRWQKEKGSPENERSPKLESQDNNTKPESKSKDNLDFGEDYETPQSKPVIKKKPPSVQDIHASALGVKEHFDTYLQENLGRFPELSYQPNKLEKEAFISFYQVFTSNIFSLIEPSSYGDLIDSFFANSKRKDFALKEAWNTFVDQIKNSEKELAKYYAPVLNRLNNGEDEGVNLNELQKLKSTM